MAAVAVMWIAGGCERANPNYVGDMASEVIQDLTSGKDLARIIHGGPRLRWDRLPM